MAASAKGRRMLLKARPWVRAVLAFAAGIGLLLLLRVHHSKVFHAENMVLLLHWAPLIVLIEALRRKAGEIRSNGMRPAVHRLYLACLCGTMVLFLFSSIVRHRWFYYLRWLPEPFGSDWLMATGWWFVLLTALVLPLALWQPRLTANALWIVLIIGQAAAVMALLNVTEGVFIGKDDHPSFVFRLWQLNETLPRLRVYNPWWNGGASSICPLTSGAVAPALILWPLLKSFPVEQVYTPGFGLIFIVLIPFAAAASVRALRGGAAAQAAAGLMALGVSQHYYLWLMHYGTIGACLTAALIIPVSALLYRVVVMKRSDVVTVVGLMLSATLMLFYPPAMLMALPLGVSVLFQWRRWQKRAWTALAICAGVVLILHAGTLLALFGEIRFDDVADPSRSAFLRTPAVELWSLDYVREGCNHILAHLREGHPVLLFMGLLGIIMTTHRRLRSWYLPLIVFPALLCGWGRFHFPHMQLSRMAIPMLFAAVIPAAIHVGELLRVERTRWALWRSALIVLLALTALNNLRMYQVKGRAGYHVFSEQNRRMAAWIRDNTPPDGRVLFAGETVHAYDGGHVAVLPLLTGREMMASDYYHFDPYKTDYEYPPHPFRLSPDGWQKFMNMYNVSIVFTYHERWKRFFENHPELFVPVAEWGRDGNRKTYRVVRECNGRVWRGRGGARAHFNRIDFTVEPGQDELVLGYNWDNGLKVDSPVEIFPFETEEGPVLVGVRLHGQTVARIKF